MATIRRIVAEVVRRMALKVKCRGTKMPLAVDPYAGMSEEQRMLQHGLCDPPPPISRPKGGRV